MLRLALNDGQLGSSKWEATHKDVALFFWVLAKKRSINHSPLPYHTWTMGLVNLPISSSMALIFSTKRQLEPRLTPDRTETLTGRTHFVAIVISSAAKVGVERRVV